MRVKIILPYKTILDIKVKKISAPGLEGYFQLLPKHIDCTWILKPGILTLQEKEDIYFAIGDGVLVKEGSTVYISTFKAIRGSSLENLSIAVEDSIKSLNEKEKKAREVLIKLETDTLKRFLEID